MVTQVSIRVDFPAAGLAGGSQFISITFDGQWPVRRCGSAGHSYPAPYFLTRVVRDGDYLVLRATPDCALCRGGRATIEMPAGGQKLLLRIGEMKDEQGHPMTWIDSA